MAFDFITNEQVRRGRDASRSPSRRRGPGSSRRARPAIRGPGIEARVHDPLWLLGRQWQLGEFEGEDAGTPLTVRVVTRTVPVDRWAPRGERRPRSRSAASARTCSSRWSSASRSPDARGPGLRARAEAAAALLAALDDAGLGGAPRDAFVEQLPARPRPARTIPDGAHAALDPAWLRLERLLARPRDGRRRADLPRRRRRRRRAAAVAGARRRRRARRAARRRSTPWAAWYRAEVSPPPGGDDAWVGERLEYRFRVGAGDHRARRAGARRRRDRLAQLRRRAREPRCPNRRRAGAARRAREVHALLASPLRYPGMPADRLWEMEDAAGQPRAGRGRAVGPRPAARRRVRADLRQRLAGRAGRRAVRLADDGRVGDVHDDLRRALRRAADRARSAPTGTGGCSRSPTPRRRPRPTAC